MDGCPGGWYVAVWDTDAGAVSGQVCRDFTSVLDVTVDCAAVGVDIPIGLADSGVRLCDVEARRLLGRKGSAVFPPPIRPILRAVSRAEASGLLMELEGKGVGYQSFAIVGKVRQVDGLMTPELQSRIVEVHPELCFRALNQGMPIIESKRSPVGFEARRGLLKSVLPNFEHLIEGRLRSRAASDDILDALVACWTARGVAEDTADWIPENPEKDAKGLRMEMWF